MKALFEELIRNMDDGLGTVLVTIVARSGSAPGRVGSRMLVRADGSIMGTIGGGAVEYRCMQAAAEVIQNKTSLIQGFPLTEHQVADIGMICGGDVTAYFQYVDPEDREFRELCMEVCAALERNQDCWLILDITKTVCWQMGLYIKDSRMIGMELPKELMDRLDRNKAVQIEADGRNYYTEPLVQAGRVYIFGGGHVAQELVPVLAHVGFRCVVIDDRAEFASQERFPLAEMTIVGELDHIDDYICFSEHDYVCVMTRGHQFDYLIQRQVLKHRLRYIGVMGSRHKIKAVTGKLLEDGYTLEEIQACHMPIGTAIRAVTPAEIAISIAGELIAVRAEKS